MNVRRLARPVTCEGIGLHTGRRSRVTFLPSKRPGIFFKLGRDKVPARLGSVIDTTRGISLGANGHAVKTVEHLLAPLVWLGIRDLEIEVQGEEIPVFDGSALPWIRLLKPYLSESEEPFPEFIVREPVEIQDGEAFLKVAPSAEFFVSYTIDYPNTPVGLQTWQGPVTPELFERELAPARTFGFIDEVKSLQKQGLGQGGNLENCVVIDRNAFLTPLRFTDEMVRHKVLDLTGDLALMRAIPKARVEIRKGSHRLHIALAKAVTNMKAG